MVVMGFVGGGGVVWVVLMVVGHVGVWWSWIRVLVGAVSGGCVGGGV